MRKISCSLPHKLTVTGNPPTQSLSVWGGKWGQRTENVPELDQTAGMHISVMYLTLAELTFLFYFIILTNPIVDQMSPAKPQRELSPTAQNYCSASRLTRCSKSLSYRKVVAIQQIMAYMNPRFVRKNKVLLVLGTLHKNTARI